MIKMYEPMNIVTILTVILIFLLIKQNAFLRQVFCISTLSLSTRGMPSISFENDHNFKKEGLGTVRKSASKHRVVGDTGKQPLLICDLTTQA